jgi:Holliday junction resolvasome RuvABC endonuclease subunit
LSYDYLIVLDPSLNSTGYAVFDIRNVSKRKKPELVDYGSINNQHFSSKQEGFKYMHVDMRLQTLRFTYPNSIVIKEEWVGSATPNGKKLATIHGLINKVFNHMEVIEDVNNKKFKAEFTGNGAAEKEDVDAECMKYEGAILKTNNKFKKLVFRLDDESDAVGIGINWLIKQGMLERVA